MGKRVIRLTESDLIRLVKRVINEDEGAGGTRMHKVWDCMKGLKEGPLISWDNDKSVINLRSHDDMLKMYGSFEIAGTGGIVHKCTIRIRSSNGITFFIDIYDEKKKELHDAIVDADENFDCKKFQSEAFLDWYNTYKK